MIRRDRRRSRSLARGKHQVSTGQATAQRSLSINFGRADRKSLLLGTALASTLLLATLTAPTPAQAAATCTVGGADEPIPAPTAPIVLDETQPIVCVNGDTRIAIGGHAIDLHTNINPGAFIYLNNSGDLTATYVTPDGGRGIRAYTEGGDSFVTVINTGDINSDRSAIYARTRGGAVTVINSGHINTVYSGIQASGGHTGVADSPVTVINTGDIDLERPGTAIRASTYGDTSEVYVNNSGALSGGGYRDPRHNLRQ